MPLQIRRGSTGDRLATTPLVGEIVYDTTTKAVYVGDGTTVGGLPVTAFSVADARSTTAKMFLGDSLSDNTVHSGITFALVGNRLQATVQQDLSNYIGLIAADQGFKGNLWADDSGLIVNSETHTVYGNFVPQGHIVPDTNIAYDLGSSAYRFRDIYLSGSSIHLGNAVITSIGTAVDLPLGTTIAGQPAGLNEGDTYNITVSGNVIGTDSTVLVDTTNGKFNGDLYGSVFADDSTMLVDAIEGVLRGTLIGALTGNVTGTLTGNASSATVASTVTLVATESAASTHYLAFSLNTSGNESVRTDTGLTYQPSTNTVSTTILNATTVNAATVGTHTGAVIGNVIGNVTGSTEGYHTGDVMGSVFAADSTMLVDATDGVLRGTLIGTLTGNAATATLATTATAASSVTLVATEASASSHYITFTESASGNQSVRTDTSLTYQPSTNTLALSVLNATSVNATNITGNIFTSLIDTSDSSAITFTPAVIFSSDVTVQNELLAGGHILPVNSESYDLGAYTKKFSKLYLTEGANALWIGNATISGSGTTINLPAGSTVGGSAITTAAGSNATTITVNTTGTSAEHFISFFDDQSGDNLIYTDDTFKYNPGTGVLTVGDATIGTVTGNLTGTVTGSLIGNASTATTATTVELTATNTTAASHFVTFVDSATGNEAVRTDTDLTYNPSTNTLTANITSSGTSSLATVTVSGNTTMSGTLSSGTMTADSNSYSGTTPLFQARQAHTTPDARLIRFARARGTLSVPVSVNNGDDITNMVFTAYGTSAYVVAASISVTVEDPAISNSSMKSRMVFGTNTGAGVVNHVTLDSDGVLTVGRLKNASIEIDANTITTLNTNDDIVFNPNGNGTVDFQVIEQTTVGAPGVASALPANPTLYFKVKVNGVEYVVPAYAA